MRLPTQIAALQPPMVKRILYTTNAIEAPNSKLRRAVRATGHFPSDEAATKLPFRLAHRLAMAQ